MIRQVLRDAKANRPLGELSRRLDGGRGLVFVHVPKCGGTSVETALRRRLVLGRRLIGPEETFRAAMALSGLPDEEEHRHALLSRASELRRDTLHLYLAEGARLVTGHAPLGAHTIDAFGPSHDFVTVLRGPVERMRSHLAANRTPAAGHGRTALTAVRFLETERARVMGALYVKYLSGLPMSADFAAQSAIDAARRTVDRLALIGFTDEMDAFAAALSERLGRRVRIGRENVGREAPALPTGLGDRIEALCAPDIAVYAHARERFGERRRAKR